MLQFIVIGGIIFAAYAARNDRPAKPQENLLIVDNTHLERLSGQFRATWMRPPTPDELKGMVDGFICEEVLVREALALGMDKDDAVIRQRLRQKMDFIASATTQSVAPDGAVLQTYYEESRSAYGWGRASRFSRSILALTRRKIRLLTRLKPPARVSRPMRSASRQCCLKAGKRH